MLVLSHKGFCIRMGTALNYKVEVSDGVISATRVRQVNRFLGREDLVSHSMMQSAQLLDEVLKNFSYKKYGSSWRDHVIQLKRGFDLESALAEIHFEILEKLRSL